MKGTTKDLLDELEIATLETVVGGFDEGLKAEGFSLYQMQGDMREYCRPVNRGSTCVSGVVRNGQFTQGIGGEDLRRNEGEPHLRHLPGASWGDFLPRR
jgi:hypothetical protein